MKLVLVMGTAQEVCVVHAACGIRRVRARDLAGGSSSADVGASMAEGTRGRRGGGGGRGGEEGEDGLGGRGRGRRRRRRRRGRKARAAPSDPRSRPPNPRRSSSIPPSCPLALLPRPPLRPAIPPLLVLLLRLLLRGPPCRHRSWRGPCCGVAASQGMEWPSQATGHGKRQRTARRVGRPRRASRSGAHRGGHQEQAALIGLIAGLVVYPASRCLAPPARPTLQSARARAHGGLASRVRSGRSDRAQSRHSGCCWRGRSPVGEERRSPPAGALWCEGVVGFCVGCIAATGGAACRRPISRLPWRPRSALHRAHQHDWWWSRVVPQKASLPLEASLLATPSDRCCIGSRNCTGAVVVLLWYYTDATLRWYFTGGSLVCTSTALLQRLCCTGTSLVRHWCCTGTSLELL